MAPWYHTYLPNSSIEHNTTYTHTIVGYQALVSISLKPPHFILKYFKSFSAQGGIIIFNSNMDK